MTEHVHVAAVPVVRLSIKLTTERVPDADAAAVAHMTVGDKLVVSSCSCC